MSTIKPDLSKLRALLDELGRGKVRDELAGRVIEALAPVWDELSGARRTAMTAVKLGSTKPGQTDRAHDLRWDPPVLTFSVVRHGAAQLGSKRGERQLWSVNLDDASAIWGCRGYEQLKPNNARLNVRRLAESTVAALAAGPGTAHEGILWKSPESAKITLKRLLPRSDNKQTQTSRTGALRRYLLRLLIESGWRIDRDAPLTVSKPHLGAQADCGSQ